MEQSGLGIALAGFLSDFLSGVHPVHSQQIDHDEPGDFSRLGRPLIIFGVHYPPPPLWVELNVCCRQAPVIGNGSVRQRGEAPPGRLRLLRGDTRKSHNTSRGAIRWIWHFPAVLLLKTDVNEKA